ncbi:hypothetical protein [Altererythrobacter sp. ZODW24]|uniref:hypothetical protein n=1 Tax=Altererythrobacter sp. ZODW24 TaxID=2185142 RepID=UPI000DF7969A|nr:hypothetical protein [Altererythrobacter sp. ZODW24]
MDVIDRIARVSAVTTAVFALAGCGEPELTQAEQAAQENAAIAAVEASQKPPAQLVFPEIITFEDIEANNLFGAGCYMLPSGEQEGMLALTDDRMGVIKLDGELHRMTVDAGSSEQPYGSRGKYDGKEFSLRLETTGEPIDNGYETLDYKGTMTLRNGRDEVVFQQDGTIQCGA